MSWVDNNFNIPYEDETFIKIIDGFLFHCPSSIKNNKGENINYSPVSNRNCSFRVRNIHDNLLTILNNNIKSLLEEDSYETCLASADIDGKTRIYNDANDLLNYSKEFMILKKNSSMSDTEAIYYCIRNALAHGLFEIRVYNNEKFYIFENIDKGKLKGRMRLKEKNIVEITSLISIICGRNSNFKKVKITPNDNYYTVISFLI